MVAGGGGRGGRWHAGGDRWHVAQMAGGAPGPEQRLRPNQADRILKSYCENLNQKYFDKILKKLNK